MKESVQVTEMHLENEASIWMIKDGRKSGGDKRILQIIFFNWLKNLDLFPWGREYQS